MTDNINLCQPAVRSVPQGAPLHAEAAGLLVAERPEGAQPQTVRPIEHMWDLIADNAATAAPDAGAAHGPGTRARARGARQH